MTTGVVATLLTVGLVASAGATAADEPLPHGYEAGHPDGWFDPDDVDGVNTAEISIDAAPNPIRQGHQPGRPDGWFVPTTSSVRLTGDVGASPDLVPHNVR